jgi:hypothetical protein
MLARASPQARLRDAFPAGFTTDRAAFVAQLAALGAAPPLPQGVTELCRDERSGARVLHAPLTSAAVRDWHARVAPFVLFFIDAGTHIDTLCAPGSHALAVHDAPTQRLRVAYAADTR